LVAGTRGRRVFDEGDLDAGIWSVGTVMGLIHDIPTCAELVSRMVTEAEEIITGRLAGMVKAAAAV
jgi:nitronate monooxygenase